MDDILIAKPLPATAAIKYEIMGKGLVCTVNIQLTSHQDAPESTLAGATTIKYYLGRISAAVESELQLMQKQDTEVIH